MEQLETAFYEMRPFLYLALGVYAMSSQDPSPFLLGCVLVLMFCTATILRWRMKARRGSTLEQLFYDLQPIAYLGLGLYAVVWLRHSKLALACALLLMFCATVIIRWRTMKR